MARPMVVNGLTDDLALFKRYPRQLERQPAYVEIDPEARAITAGINAEVGPPHAVPERVWNGRLRRYHLRALLSGPQATQLLRSERVQTLAARICDGYEEHYDGSRYMDRLSADAEDAELDLQALLDSEDDGIAVLTAADVYVDDPAETGQVTADTTDEQIAMMAAEDARGTEAVDSTWHVLVKDLEDYLREIRDRLRG